MDSRRRGHHNRRRPTPPFQIDRDGRYEISAVPPRFLDNHHHHRSSASASASSPYSYSYSSQLPSSPLPPPPPPLPMMKQEGNYMLLPTHQHSRFYMEGMDHGNFPRVLVEHPHRVSDHQNMGRFIYDSPSDSSPRGSDRVVFPHGHQDSRRSGYVVDDEFIVDDRHFLRFMVPPPPPPPLPPPPPPPYSGVSHGHSDGRGGQGVPYRWADKEEMMKETVPHHHQHQHQRMLVEDEPPIGRRKRHRRENEGKAELEGEHDGSLIVQGYDGRTMRKPGFRASNNCGGSIRGRDNMPFEREPSHNLLLTDSSRHVDGGDMVFPFNGRHKKTPRLVEDSSYGLRERRFAGKGKSMLFDAEKSQDVGCSGGTRNPKPSVLSRIQYPKAVLNRLEEHKPAFSHSDGLNNSADPDVGYKSNALANKRVLTSSSPSPPSISVVEFHIDGRNSIGRRSPEEGTQREWPFHPDRGGLASAAVVTKAVDSKNKSNTNRIPVSDKKSEGRVISLHTLKKTVVSGPSGSLKGSDLKSNDGCSTSLEIIGTSKIHGKTNSAEVLNADDSGFLNGNSRNNTPVGVSSEKMVKQILDCPGIITKKSDGKVLCTRTPVEEVSKPTAKGITQLERPNEKVTKNFSISHMKKEKIEETNLKDCEDVDAHKMLHATETAQLFKEEASKRSSISDIKCYPNFSQTNPTLKNKPNKVQAEIQETIILDHSDSEIEKDKTFKEPISQERTFTQFAATSENVTSEVPNTIEGLLATPISVSSNHRVDAVGAPSKKEAEESTFPSTSFPIVGQNCNDSVVKKNNCSLSTWANSNENVGSSAAPLRNWKRKNEENTSNLDVSTNLGFTYESSKPTTPFILPKNSMVSKEEHDIVSKKKWKRRRVKSHGPIVQSSIVQSPKKPVEEISSKEVFVCPNVEGVGYCRSSKFSRRTEDQTITHAVKAYTMTNVVQGSCVNLTEDDNLVGTNLGENSLRKRDRDTLLPSTDSTALEGHRIFDTVELNIEHNMEREDMKKGDTKMQCSILNDNSSVIIESDDQGQNLHLVDSKEDPKKSCLPNPLKRSVSEPQLVMKLDKTNLGTHLIHEAKMHQLSQEARKLIGNNSEVAERESTQARDHQKDIKSQLFPGPRLPLKAAPNQNVRNRTWRREDLCAPAPQSTRHLSQQKASSSGSSQKGHGSYVRKGNSLIRKSSTVAPPRQSLDIGAADRIDTSSTSESKIDHTDGMICSKIGGTNSYYEKPKSPPISFSSNKLTSCTLDPLFIDNLHLNKNKVEAGLEGDAVLSKDRNLDSSSPEHPSFLNIEKSKVNHSKPMVYVKHKSNQWVAASGVKNGKSSVLFDNHFIRNKNQLSCDNPLANTHIKQITSIDKFKRDNQKSSTMFLPKENIGGLYRRKPGKAPATTKKKVKEPRSMVWRLGVKSQYQKACSVSNILPRIFPWKRAASWKLSMNNTSKKLSTRSISKKLQISRKRDTIYTISKGGFSLRKSGVRSIGGSNLKWSKSIERHSKKANEEATLAVAEAERKKRERKGPLCHTAERKDSCVPRERVFRIGTVRYKMDSSRRTLVRLPDSQSSSAPNKQKSGQKSQLPFIPRRLLIGTDEYIRIGNGNQLIRDPKKHIRNLASNKIRWSVHTARLRLAKKRQYCQFFTRYGKCKKDDGKCPYIHDPNKVAICTKFLKGLCSSVNCMLTHEVVPERMPDCSYFLRGLCSNTNCPYRHVKVKSTSSVCEGFLKGYCSDGDECRKKHSYVCPDFEATGKCIDGLSCKLHHPKPRNKSRKRKRSNTNTSRNRNSGRTRYFISNTIAEPNSRMLATEGNVEKEEDVFCDGAEYISLGPDNEDVSNRVITNTHLFSTKCYNDHDIDHLIKPLLIMISRREST